MNTTRENVERYRLIARAGCRVFALLSLVMGAWLPLYLIIGLVATIVLPPSWTSSPLSYLQSSQITQSMVWLAIAFALWRFDQRIARWIVPEPPRGGCPQCGYSLKGLGDRPICPECGADLRPPSSGPSTP